MPEELHDVVLVAVVGQVGDVGREGRVVRHVLLVEAGREGGARGGRQHDRLRPGEEENINN